ncbi:MAG: ABC transporter ATP-binding protein [Pseudomonadota bacterium]
MLTIDNVSKTYANGVVALDDVSLTISPGIFGLLGPNGAGKSTLMRTLATLQQPSCGGIRFADIDVLAHPSALRESLGYLPQDFGVYPRVSAYNLLEHLAILKGMRDKTARTGEVQALLERTNLYADRHRSVSTFSGGMRQRFGIAQALLGDPQLLIVDEPTAGLDPAERNRFHRLLAELSRDKVILLSTHIVDDVEELCADLAILVSGRVVRSGAPSVLIENLHECLWCKRISHQELDVASQDPRYISTRLQAGEPVVRYVADRSPGEGFEAVVPDLEDVYFHTLTTAQCGN